MIVIETCPKCGADLLNEVLCTYPPIPQKYCPRCGWKWTGQREEVVRVPFQVEEAVLNRFNEIPNVTPHLVDYSIYEEGFVTSGESATAHYLGHAEGYSFIDACKNFIKLVGRGEIIVDRDGNEYASDWGCRWYPTLEEAQRSFG